MALTKVGKEGVVGLDNSADATAITISSGENVGIGVVPETTWNSNIDALQLGLGASIYGDNTATGLQISSNAVATLGSSLNGYKYIGSDKASTYQQYDGEHNFRVASSGSADGAITWSTAMTINNTGAITKPLQPAFLVHPASHQNNISINSATTISFGTEVFDVGSNFSSNQFVAPITGKYLLTAGIYTKEVSSSASYVEFYFNTSNRDYYFTIDPACFDSDPDFWTWSMTAIADLDANDTAKIVMLQASGSASLDVRTTTFFSGALIC